jgi:sortase A
VVVVAWVLLALVGVLAALILVGAFTEQRDQAELLEDYRVEIEAASNAAFGLPGVAEETHAPSRGEPVAVLDIGAIGLRRVVVEGSSAEETAQGPGHVVGTAAPGQPGNAVVVGRRELLGASFGDLERLDDGDDIVVTTEQGQTVYVVDSVERTSLAGAAAVDELYGPTDDDQLTLVTSASSNPWNEDDALVVVASLDGTPFAPTPQGGRTVGDDGRAGGSLLTAPLVLAAMAAVLAIAGAVWLFRTVSWRAAYVLTVPLLVAVCLLVAEQLARTLPPWS